MNGRTFRKHYHLLLQLGGLLLCMLLAAPLMAFVLHPHGTAPASSAPAHTGPTAIPTARIIGAAAPTSAVVRPTPLPTATAQPTATVNSAASVPFAQPVAGPGGLPYPLRLAHLNYGAVGHFYYTNRDSAFTMAQQAGFGWIRQQVHWRDIEDKSGAFYWDDLDNIVAEANDHGLLVLLSVVRSPAWYTADGNDGMPDDPAALARFLTALVQHYQGQIHAIEVWNEQNLAHENGGSITLDDAGQYVELLAAAYQAIKAVDPTVIVVAGAPASTATDMPTVAVPDIAYLEAMYSYRDGMIRDYFDAQALHPVSTANPPDTLWPDNPHTGTGWNEHETFYFRHIENGRRVMEEAGLGRHQVWLTEFGWATANNTPGYEYGNQISLEMQRDYIVRAMELTYEQYPWVSNMFVWNLNFSAVQREYGVDPLHEQGSFSIVNEDWTPRPAYLGMQAFIQQHSPPQN
jgi:hypothetical protein